MALTTYVIVPYVLIQNACFVLIEKENILKPINYGSQSVILQTIEINCNSQQILDVKCNFLK